MNKCFVDSNIIIRYIIDDIPEQSEIFSLLLDKAEMGDVELVCNSMVIAEIVWTLSSFYKFSKEKITEVLQGIIASKLLSFCERTILLRSLEDFKDLNIDFIDAYIAAWMNDHDVQDLYTFNKKHFKRLSHVNVLDFSSRAVE